MWSFKKEIHKYGINIHPDPPCSIGMDVAFLIDYTGSMSGIINTVKASVSNIISAINAEVGAGNYRLGLVVSDEYTLGALPNYNGSAGYIALPSAQKHVNSGVGRTQYNTAMELFSSNNENTFTTQLNLLNTPQFPLGGGVDLPEPLDMALDYVVNNNFLNAFRVNVAKYILIFTDALPGGNDDIYNGIDVAKITTLTNDCINAKIKVFIIGGGANQTVWQNLATNTGGSFNTSFDSAVIISQIVASCKKLEPPVSNAGVDQTIKLPIDFVNLNGTSSFDLDGSISTYLWEQTTTLPANIVTPNSATTIVTGLTVGNYIFKLTVTDNDSLVDTDSMVVKVDPSSAINLKSTSILPTWQATNVIKTGTSLIWDVVGGVVSNQVGDNPIFNFSLNVGSADITVYPALDITTFNVPSLNITDISISDAINLTTVDVASNDINTLDVTTNVNVTFLGCSNNNISSLDVTNNLALINLQLDNNNISTIDISNNVLLETLKITNNSLVNLSIANNPALLTLTCDGNTISNLDLDNILIQLDTNGLSNGNITIPLGRTIASDTAKANLLTKSWTITEI